MQVLYFFLDNLETLTHHTPSTTNRHKVISQKQSGFWPTLYNRPDSTFDEWSSALRTINGRAVFAHKLKAGEYRLNLSYEKITR